MINSELPPKGSVSALQRKVVNRPQANCRWLSVAKRGIGLSAGVLGGKQLRKEKVEESGPQPAVDITFSEVLLFHF